MDVLQAQGHVNEDAAMMGLAIIFVFVMYLLFSAIVVWVTVIWARRHGRNTRRWGWGAVLAMYLLPFWDLIPTVLLHKYRCATEAGFWVYKTPEQWAKENPGVLETLSATHLPEEYYKGLPPGYGRGTTSINRYYVLPDGTELFAKYDSTRRLMYVDLKRPDGSSGFRLNERINWLVRTTGPHLVNLWKHEEAVVDSKNEEVLARYVDFRAGYGNWLEGGTRHGWQGAKFWLQNDHCAGGEINKGKLWSIEDKLRGTKEGQ